MSAPLRIRILHIRFEPDCAAKISPVLPNSSRVSGLIPSSSNSLITASYLRCLILLMSACSASLSGRFGVDSPALRVEIA
eukprot:3740712-Rhodomonas_salina.2